MRKSRLLYLPFLLGFLLFPGSVLAQSQNIMIGSQLSEGFDMGVNSSGGRTDWLSNNDGYMRMAYPSSQSWGAVFVTVGTPRNPPRPSRDFSAFDLLTVEMKGEVGGEKLKLGIKTNTQPDDGSETTEPVTLSTEWKIYEFPLSAFTGTDPKRLYIVAEFVFGGPQARTVYFRNIRYTRQANSGSLTPSSKMSGGVQLSSHDIPKPLLTISQPAADYELAMWASTRPSLIVKGKAENVPEDYNLYLVVHPVHSDEIWTQKVSTATDEWLTQAYFGDDTRLPWDGESFQMFAVLSNTEFLKSLDELCPSGRRA